MADRNSGKLAAFGEMLFCFSISLDNSQVGESGNPTLSAT
jgi:hypothetical protein